MLATVLAGSLIVNGALIVGLRTAWPDTGVQPIYWFLTGRQGGDSWRGMLRAHDVASTAEGRGALYEHTFFSPDVRHDGFQYPPTALLVVSALDRVNGAATASALRAITWLAIPLTALLVFWIAGSERRLALLGFAAALAATLVFYPVMRAYRNGQIQTWLTAAFAASLLAFVCGRPATSGGLVGLACLVKPQWSLVLVWAGLRREWRFAGGFVAAMDRTLSAVPARRVRRHARDLRAAPRHRADPPRAPEGDRALDYALMALAATIASPIAWEHHYGVLLPIFALLLRRWDAGRLAPWPAGVLAAAFVLTSTHVHAANRLASTRWNVLQSLLLIGALVVFAVLVRVRR